MDGGDKEQLIAWLDRMRDEATQEWISSGYDKFHAGARSAFSITAVAIQNGNYLAAPREQTAQLDSQFHPDMWLEQPRGGAIARLIRRLVG